jgi:hypothetical protein
MRKRQGLFAAGCIGEGNFGFPQKIQWARAARTDKGVHALGNCVSVRLLLEDDVDPVGFPPMNVELDKQAVYGPRRFLTHECGA